LTVVCCARADVDSQGSQIIAPDAERVADYQVEADKHELVKAKEERTGVIWLH
jgi:hypothetical protein